MNAESTAVTSAKLERPWRTGTLTLSSGIVGESVAGFGTTLVAAMRLGRRYVGFEIEETTVIIARGRLASS